MAYDVSVIVPIYNMEAHVPSGIDMLKAQTCKNMEVILVNDGSSDGSEAAVKKAIEGLAHYTLVTTPNQGSGPARNTGIARATGKYLYFFDIDDHLEPYALEHMVASADDENCDLLVFSYDTTKAFGSPVHVQKMIDTSVSGDDMRKSFENYMKLPTMVSGAPWHKLFRRDVTVEHKVEFPPLRRHQDEGFIMRYAAVARSVHFSSEVLYHHLLNDQSRRWKKYPLNYDTVIESLIDMFETIVIAWNPQNNAVRKNVCQIYYDRNLDFLKVLFNPKWKFSHMERYRRLKARQKVFEARSKKYADIDIPHDNYWNLIQGKHYIMLYCALQYRIIRNRLTGV